ncbi:hypothetical protein H6F42_20605 [Pseudanabaena sp. FACHB-1998]|uniref:hypothetical protein n=1 Tax=Pseudanabaena sp. FACHB-1998 TaxID=2692858 RepID=UPI00168163E0|nr:hypothetical protein [Pseudanabaena sp. FACHB-1998]MBD2179329.1 hypothetical protein [Pseudanabaena sp. FACHB-1998]
MRHFSEKGFIALVTIATLFSSPLGAIATNSMHEQSSSSKLFRSFSITSSIYHNGNPHLPRPKGSR